MKDVTAQCQEVDSKTVPSISENMKYMCLLGFGTLLFLIAFFFNSPKEILEGNIIILTSTANLITDYFYIANIGAAFMNASIMVFLTIAIIKKSNAQISGVLVAVIFTVAGFSLFGKNLYNSIPIILGVYFYAKFQKKSFQHFLLPAFFGTALGPIVSEITFKLTLPLYLNISFGILAGIFIGFVLPPMSSHFMNFHKGFSLYNIGFTAGIIGTFFISLLRSFDIEVDAVYLVSIGNNTIFSILLYCLFVGMFLLGLYFNKWKLNGLMHLFTYSGKAPTDYVVISGFGVTLINMAILGFFSTTYVLLVGGELNGPVLGGIFTVVGFGAYGKHIRNVTPILIGVFVVGYFSSHDISSTATLLAALFGTTLAPISGFYGPLAGMIAGGLHIAMVTNISYLHAGMNLYNNGYSGGFIAATLVPIFDELMKSKKRAS